jgi:phosphonate transport system permease protein
MKKPNPVLRIGRITLTVAVIAAVYWWAWQVTGIDPAKLADLAKGMDILTDFATPNFFTRDVELTTIEIAFPIPCGSAPESEQIRTGPRLVPSVPCAAPGEEFTLEGFELVPNVETVIRWEFPDGRQMTAIRTTTDANGYFSETVQARPIAASEEGVASRLAVDTLKPVGRIQFSDSFKEAAAAMFVTIFMALFSTTLATIIAAPLSFLAASNIMRHSKIGTTVYYVTRSFFNLVRAYDPLVMATVFGFWLGFGPLPGILALTVVTVASLGKLFSESIEGIDNGPIEAIHATGATRTQNVVYAVIPQIVPDFVSFIIYHWDINVRISTIIGFVGGGGIGYYLNEQINGFHYNDAATAIWLIVIVVMAMDFLSAEVRKRLT